MVLLRDRVVPVPPEPGAVREVRHTVAETLDGYDDDVVDRALLCTSELVTNAIEHGRPPVVLRIAAAPGHVRIEVHDGSTRPPRRQRPPPSCVRGRGLVIVERCTDRWGVHRWPAGKTVWCELSATADRDRTTEVRA